MLLSVQRKEGRQTCSPTAAMSCHILAAVICWASMPNATLNVSLSKEQLAQVNREVDSGQYVSASEVVREALRLLEEHEKVRAVQLAEFREESDRRLASLERGEGINGAMAQAQLRQRAHARRQAPA